MQVPAWLVRSATAGPERPALCTREGTLTAAALLARARGAAGALAAQGAGPGSRVAIVLGPGEPFAVALHGCWLLGAVAVPIDQRLTAEERARQAQGCAALVEGPLLGPPRAVGEEAHSLDGVAAVIHTSGSTGLPRPVELTFGNLLWSALGTGLALGLGRGDRWLSTLPVAHVGGLSILVRCAVWNATAVLEPRFDVQEFGRRLEAGEATVASLVPTMLGRLLDAGLQRPRGLRAAMLGGAPPSAALLERAAAAGIPLARSYGLTEAASAVTLTPPGDAGSDGVPLPFTRIAAAQSGEILVAGPTVAPGSVQQDGWLHTGDLGRIDPAGRLHVTGRAGEQIITGGENVSPTEVEGVLADHPAVAEAAVHARPSAEWGEEVVATVVLEPGAQAGEAELRAHCAAHLAGFKVPKAIGFSAALPRTPSGKLLRRELGRPAP